MPPTLIPTLAYDDAPAAIEWLVTALGFARNLVVPGEPGKIAHAQLTLGGDMIMVSSTRLDQHRLESPKTLGHPSGGIYIVLTGSIDAHCERARAAGATIVSEPIDHDYGGRGYGCADPEGHLWSFGTYAPTIDAQQVHTQ